MDASLPTASESYHERVNDRARLIGMNHVAIEVGDLDAALELYGKLFDFELRGRGPRMAFIDMGDQFLAVSEGRTQGPDDGRFHMVDNSMSNLVTLDDGVTLASVPESSIERAFLRPGATCDTSRVPTAPEASSTTTATRSSVAMSTFFARCS